MTAWIFKVKGNNKPFILDFLQLYCKLQSLSLISPLFLANSREYFIPLHTETPHFTVRVSMFSDQSEKYNNGHCSAHHSSLTTLSWRYEEKLTTKETQSVSQPASQASDLRRRRTSYKREIERESEREREWWINDKWNIVWAGESSDWETALEAREIRRVKFKINFLQRPGSCRIRRGSNFESKKSVATRSGILAGQCPDCSALHTTTGTFVVARKFTTNKTQKQIQDHQAIVPSLSWGLRTVSLIIAHLVMGRMCWGLVDKVTVLWLGAGQQRWV